MSFPLNESLVDLCPVGESATYFRSISNDEKQSTLLYGIDGPSTSHNPSYRWVVSIFDS